MPCRVIPLLASNRVAHRDLVIGYVNEAITQLKKYEAWAGGFSETLVRARASAGDLEEGFVWQDEWVDFWEPFTVIQRELFSLYDSLLGVNTPFAELVESYIDPPEKAQIEFATDGAKMLSREGFSRKQIAYQVARLERWHQNFGHWLGEALRELQTARREI